MPIIMKKICSVIAVIFLALIMCTSCRNGGKVFQKIFGKTSKATSIGAGAKYLDDAHILYDKTKEKDQKRNGLNRYRNNLK